MLYNQLPHIKVAQHTPMPKVPQILEVLRKYGLQKVIGVARLHKHYDLKSDQFVVWKVKGDTSQSQVLKQKKSPMSFALDGKDWVATEYYQGDDIWQTLQKDNSFELWTRQINQIIKGDEKIYGLILRLTKGGDMEETLEGQRTQKVFPREAKEYKGEVITKFWADGPIGECSGHSGSCYSYCCRD